MSYKDTNFMSGDIGLSRGKGWFSRAIRFVENWHTGRAWANHGFGFIGPNLIVEAVAKIRLVKKEFYEEKQVKVYRLPLDDFDRDNLKYGLIRRVNQAYGWLKLPLFVLDACCTKVSSLFGYRRPVFFFTKVFGISNIPVCTQLLVWALHNFTKYRLKDIFGEEVNWRVVSPDYLDDLLQLEINQAEVIYENL